MNSMRRNRRQTFEELVKENKRQLLSDRDAIERIEERIEKRYEMQLFKQAE
ncbi:Fur-regulated basic protein B [Bacillus sp. 166amftsu]|nr:Fur-regulated basic protein B [Bacillus sp. 166amftsu]